MTSPGDSTTEGTGFRDPLDQAIACLKEINIVARREDPNRVEAYDPTDELMTLTIDVFKGLLIFRSGYNTGPAVTQNPEAWASLLCKFNKRSALTRFQSDQDNGLSLWGVLPPPFIDDAFYKFMAFWKMDQKMLHLGELSEELGFFTKR